MFSVEPPAVFEKCEFCGTEEQMAKFSKRSKRFCSMGCAKRYNVAHRISVFKPRGRGGGGRPRKNIPFYFLKKYVVD